MYFHLSHVSIHTSTFILILYRCLILSKHTDSWLSNGPCESPASVLMVLNTYWTHTGWHGLLCHSQLLFHTGLTQSDPLIDTWTANSGPALFVVCALSASSWTPHAESIRFYMGMYAYICVWEAESVCFGLYSHHDGAVNISMWKWVLAGWLGVSSHMCSSGSVSVFRLDLPHGTTRLMGLAANTWPLEESKPYSLYSLRIIPRWRHSLHNRHIQIQIRKAVVGTLNCRSLIFSGKYCLEDWLMYCGHVTDPCLVQWKCTNPEVGISVDILQVYMYFFILWKHFLRRNS